MLADGPNFTPLQAIISQPQATKFSVAIDWQYRVSKQLRSTQQIIIIMSQITSADEGLPTYSENDVQIDFSNFITEREIGKGSFGVWGHNSICGLYVR